MTLHEPERCPDDGGGPSCVIVVTDDVMLPAPHLHIRVRDTLATPDVVYQLRTWRARLVGAT